MGLKCTPGRPTSVSVTVDQFQELGIQMGGTDTREFSHALTSFGTPVLAFCQSCCSPSNTRGPPLSVSIVCSRAPRESLINKFARCLHVEVSRCH